MSAGALAKNCDEKKSSDLSAKRRLRLRSRLRKDQGNRTLETSVSGVRFYG
jgi:hypothetical protein